MLQARTLSAVLPMVFGSLVPDIVEVSAQQGQLQLSGFVSKPPAGSSTPATQLLYVNKHCVACPEAAKLISALHQTVLQRLGRPHGMAGATLGRAHKDACGHPAFALALTCPLSCYEVICEPSRPHVGFKDTAAVLRLLEAAVLQSWHDLLSEGLITAVQEARAGDPSQAGTSGKHAVSVTEHEPVVSTSNRRDIAVRTRSRDEHAMLAQPRCQQMALPIGGGGAAPHGQSAQGVKEFYSMSARQLALKRKRSSSEDGRRSAPAAITAQSDHPAGDEELEALLQQPLSPLEPRREASRDPIAVVKRCRPGQLKHHNAPVLMQSDHGHLPGRLRGQVAPPTEAFQVPDHQTELHGFCGEPPSILQQQLRCSRKLQATTLGRLGPSQRTACSPLAETAEAGGYSLPWEGSAAEQERSTPAVPVAAGQLPEHPRQPAAFRPARRPEREHKLPCAETAAEGATPPRRLHWEPLSGVPASFDPPVRHDGPPAWQQRRRAHSAPPHPAPRTGVARVVLSGTSGRLAAQTLNTQKVWCSNAVGLAEEYRAGRAETSRNSAAQLALDAISGAGASTSASPALTETTCLPLQAPGADSAGAASEQAAHEQRLLPTLPCGSPATGGPALTGTCQVEEQQARQQEPAAAAPASSAGQGSTAARAAAPQTPSVPSRLPFDGPKAPASSRATARCFCGSSREVAQESGGLDVSQQAEALAGKDENQLFRSAEGCPDAEHAIRSGRGPRPAPRVAGQSLHLQQLLEGAHRHLAVQGHAAGSCRLVPARARLPVSALQKASARQVTLCCFNIGEDFFPTCLPLLALTCFLSRRQRCWGSKSCLAKSCHTAGAQTLVQVEATTAWRAACCQSSTPPASSSTHTEASHQWQSCSGVLACQLCVPPWAAPSCSRLSSLPRCVQQPQTAA